MATIDLGRLGFVNKGTYNNSTTYEKNDLVQFTDGGLLSTYLYIDSTAQSGQAPSSSGTAGSRWVYFAKGGAAGTDVAATLANKEISFKTNAGALDGVPIGSAGEFLKVNSGATGYEFGAVSSDFVRLGTVTSGFANTIAVDFFTSTYEIYKVFVEGVRISNAGAGYGIRFNSSAGTAVSGSYYRHVFTGGYRNNSGTNNSAQSTSAWDADVMLLSNGSPNSYEMGNHEITVYLPMESDTRTRCIVTGGGFENNHIYSRHGHGVYNSAQAHTGLTFLATSGTIAIDHCEVYGIK